MYLKILFWLYIIALLAATLLFFRGAPYAPIELDPIASYRRAMTAPAHLSRIEIRGIILNIAMFIPLGLMPPAIWPRLSKAYFMLPLVFAATLSIETTQLLTSRGVFAIEDIIHNTAGGILGFLIFKALFKKKTLDKTQT
ncbi:MAG: VanZ family protein [Defluviitaleaceae bacterium]|nr:VanZ family protein [Defluviitaleaceae bacterium]